MPVFPPRQRETKLSFKLEISFSGLIKKSIDSKRSLFKQTYHQNIIDEALELVTSTIYKLKFLK